MLQLRLNSQLTVLLKELFSLIDLRGQIGASTSIRVIQHHKCAMILAYTLFGELTFTISQTKSDQALPEMGRWLLDWLCATNAASKKWKGATYESWRIKAASRLFIFGSKPPL